MPVNDGADLQFLRGSPILRARSRALFPTAFALSLLGAACGAASGDNVVRAQKEYELAVGLLGEQNVPAAFEHLFKAVDLDRQNPEPHQLLGNLYMLRGDLERAEQEL